MLLLLQVYADVFNSGQYASLSYVVQNRFMKELCVLQAKSPTNKKVKTFQ